MTLRLAVVLDAETQGLERGLGLAGDELARLEDQATRAGEAAAAAGRGVDQLGDGAQGTGRQLRSYAAGAREAADDTRRVREEAASATTSLSRLRSIGLGILGGLGASMGLAQLVSQIGEAEQIGLRLEAVLRATGSAIPIERIDAFAASLQRLTGRSADEVRSAAAALATYTSIAEAEFTEVLRIADDMAAVFGGGLRENADRLARALDDPINGFIALRRQGFALSEAEYEVVRSLMAMGDAAGAQRVVLANLRDQIGGAAAGQSQGLTGAFAQLRNAIGDYVTDSDRAVGASAVLAGIIRTVADNIGVLAAAAGAGGAAYGLGRLAVALRDVSLAGAAAAGRGAMAGIGALFAGPAGWAVGAAALVGVLAAVTRETNAAAEAADAYQRFMAEAAKTLGEMPARITAATAAVEQATGARDSVAAELGRAAIEREQELADSIRRKIESAAAVPMAGVLGEIARMDVWPAVTEIGALLDRIAGGVGPDGAPETVENLRAMLGMLQDLRAELVDLGYEGSSAVDDLSYALEELARQIPELAASLGNLGVAEGALQQLEARGDATPKDVAMASGAGFGVTIGPPAEGATDLADAAMAREAAWRQERNALEALLRTYQAAGAPTDALVASLAEAERAHAARLQAYAEGQSDVTGYIATLAAEKRAIDELNAALDEQRRMLVEAARLESLAVGGTDQLADRWAGLVQLLEDGRISQAAFAAGAREIRTDGLEAYEAALRAGQDEIAALIEQQLIMQATMETALAGVTTATTGLMGQVRAAIDAVLQAGIEAGGVLAMVAAAARGLLGLGGETEAPGAGAARDPLAELEAQLAAIRAGLKPRGARSGGGGGGGSERDPFGDEVRRVEEATRALRDQAAVTGLAAQAAARLATEQRLLNAASDAGIAVTDEMRRAIAEQADAYAEAAEALARLQAAEQRREADAAGAVQLIERMATAEEARARELAELARISQALAGADPIMLERLAAAGYDAADAMEALQRRWAELQDPQLRAFLGDIQSAFGDFFRAAMAGGEELAAAWEQLWQRIADAALQRFVIEPLLAQIDQLVLGLAGAGGGLGGAAGGAGAGGGLAGLFGGAANDNAAGAAGVATIHVGTATIIAGATGGALGAAGVAIDGAADQLATSADGIAGAAGDFEGGFGGALAGLARGIELAATSFLQLFGQALAAIVSGLGGGGGGILGALGGLFGGLFGGGVDPTLSPGVGLGGLYHSGGIVGSGGAPLRAVDAGVWAGAPRLHRGGLLPGERPIIAQDGEGVFTPRQMDSADRLFAMLLQIAGRQQGVTVIDQRGASAPALEERETTGLDGQRQVQIVVRDSVRGLIHGGAFDQDMAARYGARVRGRAA